MGDLGSCEISHLVVMISLTGRGHGDNLSTVNLSEGSVLKAV